MPLIFAFLFFTAFSAQGASFFDEPHPAHELVRRLVRTRPLAQPLRENPRVLKVEIGAADEPLCADCVQVDKYASQYDLASVDADSRFRGKKPAALLRAMQRRYRGLPGFRMSLGELTAPWAAAQGGIIADAQSLPFQDRSVGFLVTKCFPWFFYPCLTGSKLRQHRAFVRRILAEYLRVLTDDGVLILLTDDSSDPGQGLDSFLPHALIAAELGFDAIPVPAAPTRRELGRDRRGRFHGVDLGAETLVLVKRGSSCSELLMGATAR